MAPMHPAGLHGGCGALNPCIPEKLAKPCMDMTSAKGSSPHVTVDPAMDRASQLGHPILKLPETGAVAELLQVHAKETLVTGTKFTLLVALMAATPGGGIDQLMDFYADAHKGNNVTKGCETVFMPQNSNFHCVMSESPGRQSLGLEPQSSECDQTGPLLTTLNVMGGPVSVSVGWGHSVI
ncbi:hypothetical protein NDU88_002224 [Pleurodeles waltl]|uniref:Uncharacterized protein n=1 Tax=Pleurodeles waltl TaxID=8319 RepID=A0AAV7P8U4_PLEWA|nr:hypothetical protein NDU88_002224 [Pleurodeles waltl]